jgi:hypothetical protein
MNKCTLPPLAIEDRHYRREWSFIGALVSAIDARLRHRYGVGEYTGRPDCIFRIQIDRVSEETTLRDGTRLCRDDRVVDLHLWNEQLPRMAANGPTFGWALRFSRGFEASLRELATYLATRPDLEDVAAIRAYMSIGSAAQRDQLSRVVGRFGFETIAPTRPPTVRERARRFCENILFSMMVYARNPAGLRRDALRRDRTLAYLSRQTLQSRYGQPSSGGVGRSTAMRPARFQT